MLQGMSRSVGSSLQWLFRHVSMPLSVERSSVGLDTHLRRDHRRFVYLGCPQKVSGTGRDPTFGPPLPITPRRLKHVASYPHSLSSGAAFSMQTVYGGFPAPGFGSGGGPMFARPPGDQFGYLVDPASSICLSQRLSHASLSTHGRYSETANGSLNQLWFL